MTVASRAAGRAGSRAPQAARAPRRRSRASLVLAAMRWHVVHLALAVACAMPARAAHAAGAHAPAAGRQAASHAVHGVDERGSDRAPEHGRGGPAGAPSRGPSHAPSHAPAPGGHHEALGCAAAGACGGMLAAPAVVETAGEPAAEAARAPRDVPRRAPAVVAAAPEPPLKG